MTESTKIEGEVKDLETWRGYDKVEATYIKTNHNLRGNTKTNKLFSFLDRLLPIDLRPLVIIPVNESMRVKKGDKLSVEVKKK